MKSSALLACGALLACTPAGDRTEPTSSAAPGGSSAPISDAARELICKAQPCGGGDSIIHVYRDGAGAVKRLYRLYGTCFHSPGIYFDPGGKQTEIIPERPIEPGSEAERATRAKHEAQIGGLTKAEEIRCK